MNWALLSKEERRELAACIDFILDFLLFVPVRKEAGEIEKLEQQLQEVLGRQWNEQTKKAIENAVEQLRQLGEPVTPEKIDMVLKSLEYHLGPGMAASTAKKVAAVITAAYMHGRKTFLPNVSPEVSLNLIDEQAREMLTRHTIFWIGNYYSEQLGETIAVKVKEMAVEQGLGREEVGKVLKSLLGEQFKRSDAYWRGLAANTVTRARNLGVVESMVEAEIEEYEIVAVMDERTSAICREMNGRIFRVERAVELRNALLAAKSPEDVKNIAPWRDVAFVRGKATRSLPTGMALPPYHFHCFPPGTIVTTVEGPRPIETIGQGDLVLTHTGQWKPVKAVMVRHYEGDLIIVDCLVASTPDHPFLVRTDSGAEWRPAISLVNCSLLRVVLQSQWKPGGESNDCQNLPDMWTGISSLSVPQPCEVLFHRVPQPGESKSSHWKDQGKKATPSQGKPDMSTMREGVPGIRRHGEVRKGDLLQQGMQRQSAGYQDYAGLCNLREGVSEEQSLPGKGLWEILLAGLQEQGQERGKTLQVERRGQNRQGGLYIRVPPRTSVGQQPGVCPAASPGNGEVAGAIPCPRRNNSPQEWYSNGQQARKPDALFEQLGASAIPQGTEIYFQWFPVSCLERRYYRGPVYNLEVADDESYIANGFVVHNCRTTVVSRVSTERVSTATIVPDDTPVDYERERVSRAQKEARDYLESLTPFERTNKLNALIHTTWPERKARSHLKHSELGITDTQELVEAAKAVVLKPDRVFAFFKDGHLQYAFAKGGADWRVVVVDADTQQIKTFYGPRREQPFSLEARIDDSKRSQGWVELTWRK